jgi:short-subunit dehydrogenase
MASAQAGQERVFLTGASSGIGAEFALHFAKRGAVLGLVARNQQKLNDIQADVIKQVPGAQVATYIADVRDVAALKRAATQFITSYGCPTVVIANAGVSIGVDSEIEADLKVFEEVLQINVLGIANTFHPFIAAMKASAAGSRGAAPALVGIASVASIRGLPGAGAYCASKSAAVAYLESLRIELRESGVKVVTICPGFIRTDMTAKNPYPMPFLMDADDAVRRIVKVIDARSSYAIVPWQMGAVGYLLRRLPNWLLDRILVGRKRKPRQGDL